MPPEDGTSTSTQTQATDPANTTPSPGSQPPQTQPPQGKTPQSPDEAGDGETPPQTPLDFDTWLGEQDETIKTLITTHTTALKKALESERRQRKELASQLRDASDAQEEGSAAKTALEEISNQVEITNQRADFYEAAVDPKVGLTNPRLAWLAVQQDNLLEEFTRRGNVDYPALLNHLKEHYPELFAAPVYPTPPANAGTGVGQGGLHPSRPVDMNEIIRRKAGIRVS